MSLPQYNENNAIDRTQNNKTEDIEGKKKHTQRLAALCQ